MAVYVEISHIAMHPLAHVVRQPAHRQDIGGAIEGYSILKAEPLADKDFLRYGQKARVVCLKPVGLKPVSGAG
jgi:hypothetical protein